MADVYAVLTVIQSLGISLGVGSSTIAMVYYLISVGHSDETKKQMTKMVYTTLRVAMIIIFITTILIAYILFANIGAQYITSYTLALWTYIAVLFGNAILMTARLMPRIIGPGLQGATWYALGITVALPSDVVLKTPYYELLFWFIGLIGLVIVLVNLWKAHQKGTL